MAFTTTEIFLIAMLIIYTVPYLLWRVLRTEYFAPLVVIQILCGILLGPGVLGGVFPSYYEFVFRPEIITMLGAIASWAVMIFVWIAGIELDLKSAWQNRRETGVTAGLALFTPLLFGCAAGALLLGSGDTEGPEWIGQAGAAVAFLLVGAGLHTTQTAGLALAADLAPAESRPRVVALLYVMLLLGMVGSATAFALLLSDFSQLRLIQVLQGAAIATLVLNVVALWKQEARRPPAARPPPPRPPSALRCR